MSDICPQHSSQQTVIPLRDISNIERIDLKPYCLLLEAKEKRYFLALKSDEELYSWQDDIYSRSPLMGVSNPTNFVHKVHVGYDQASGLFTVNLCSPDFQCTLFTAISRACLNNGINFSASLPLRGRTMPKIHKPSSMSSNST